MESPSGSGEKFGPRKREKKSYADVLIVDWYGSKKDQEPWGLMQGRLAIMMIPSTPGNFFP